MRRPRVALPGAGRRRRAADDAILRQVGRWLDADVADDAKGAGSDLEELAGWDATTWDRAAEIAVIQGVAPVLHVGLAGTAVGAQLPARIRDGFALQHERTAARSARLHEDLERILDAAAAAGVPVMPLKGALLTTRGLVDPALRPTADLDLLIADHDRPAMLAALLRLGYAIAPGPRTPGRDELLDPGGGRVVSRTSEHPDNPRPVELLRRVDKRPWGGRAAYDLTAALWAGARPGEVLGRAAMLPSVELLLVHLAAHATMNLVAGTGRLLQWLDVAAVAAHVPVPADSPVPWLVHPALTLAHRLLPSMLPEAAAWRELEVRVPPRLRCWAASVPLDTRSGLADGSHPADLAAWRRWWDRWRPAPWRLQAGYGDLSLPRAAAIHARAAIRQRRYWQVKTSRRRRRAKGGAAPR